ncbi:hypothetical protein DRQ33_05430 [bacterium]|nr:MAG: hypothetical protein DRQ33_05430 [bacterium]
MVKADETYSVSFQNWNDDLSTKQDGIFTKFTYDRCANIIYNQSEPDLPVKTIHLIIPRHEKVDSLTYTVSETTLVGHYLPYPVQEECDTCIEDYSQFVPPDSEIYSDTIPFPEKVAKIVNTRFYDGANKIITIQISPLSFVGADTLIYVNEIINLTIHTSTSIDTGKIPCMHSLIGNKSSLYALKALIENDAYISSYSVFPSSSTIARDYIIITQDSLIDYWCEFAEWKRDKSYKVRIRNVSWITSTYGGTNDAEKIKNYLTIAFTDSGAQYVLLGGDFLNVPAYESYSDGLIDIGYSHIVSSTSLDLRVMRIPVVCGTDITNWTKKLIQYEKNPGYGNTQYLDWGLFTAADIATDEGTEIAMAAGHTYAILFEDESCEFERDCNCCPEHPTAEGIIDY